jgi:DNA segregation ATPase FtsK/SpoIIIE-like protein
LAQQKPAKTTKVEPRAKGKAAPPEPPKPDPVQKYTPKPEFWDSVLDSLPPWGDEIAAILLIVFGIVSFVSLLDVPTDETISAAWSNALTTLFGYGSAIICFGIFALGVVILLPKLGIVIRFPTRRILAIEIGFLSILALLHLLVQDAELRSLARLGRGGGQVGWALSSMISWVLGEPVAIAFYGLILLLSVAIIIGVDRVQVGRWLTRAHEGLTEIGLKLNPPKVEEKPSDATSRFDEALAPQTPVVADVGGVPTLQSPSAALTARVRAHNITRVRIDPERVPPSLRAAPLPTFVEDDDLLPQKERREFLSNFNAIGNVLPRKNKAAPIMVERPDGRLKRYFPVENMKEARAAFKRSPDLPPLDLMRDVPLNLPDEQEINNNVVLIENTLLEFDIDVDVVDVKIGPTVTQYAVQPFRETTDAEGETTFNRTRVNKIASLANDLALSLSARRLRIEAPVAGTTYVGVEVPNRNPSVVALRSVYESKSFRDEAERKKAPLYIPLGRDVAGQPLGVDLATMPHLLVAGTTGSGKSVAMAAIATALVLENPPDLVKLVMLDPKMVELSRFNGLPHLLGPVETDQERIIEVLRWCTREMDRRYKLLEEHAARNIDTYNARLGRRRREDFMPYIVIMIDEVGDLMLMHPDETEKTLTRLAQMARAVGMHLIVATQRPSVDVITGLIKANFPSRISFAVTSSVDSRVILDTTGAENLMGRGDMLFYAADATGPRRVQGCFVSDDEVRAIVAYWKDWHQRQVIDGKAQGTGAPPWLRGLTRREFLSETDPMLEQAISLVIAEREASASLIQRRLGVGYPRAARIMDLLQEIGIVGPAKPGERGREVLVKPGQDPFKELIDRKMNKE